MVKPFEDGRRFCLFRLAGSFNSYKNGGLKALHHKDLMYIILNSHQIGDVVNI